MSELLTIYDSLFNEIGTKERTLVHAEGDWHAVSHCWVLSRLPTDNGGKELWVWLQQRAHNKDNAPDFYDITVGGHIRAGERPSDALLRETEEEIGLSLLPQEVCLLGITKEDCVSPISHFIDREFNYVFLHLEDAPCFHPGEEVQDMVRIRAKDLCEKALHGRKVLPAVSLTRGEILLRAEQFCVHPNEFSGMVLPALGETK
ncbi:MAG: NUDIX domain-containing protein [Oscillospiraceae bacterium]|nr:NUDIX domain-containing protein [Oscillospiraceae bacterium]MDD3260654.1 NUDIX domain-containing protein [Oscillospiraceae bacterium]